ncbi:unnamed protein product [Cylindrotheca closterium]|uniref:EamA domain-containing protein n=1 Tax=Cylindrotheca closterium TaxID=2856 RepID=A0AAD2G4K0_9STRA|nr:unnamed protein product [Cylindrotheca closterium]
MLRLPSVSPYTLGLVFIFLVAVIWSAASVLVKVLYDQADFKSPFLLTYIGGALFTIFLPLECRKLSPSSSRDDRQATDTDNDGMMTTQHDDYHLEGLPPSLQQHQQEPKHYWTVRDHIVASAKLAPLWFLANYAFYASLQYISITSSTILASTGSLFTFILALWLKDERFHWWKLTGVTLGILGSILTAKHDAAATSSGGGGGSSNESTMELWGDLLGLLSAAGWGGYAVMVRVLCPKDESLMSMQLFLGCLGVWIAIGLSPVLIWELLHLSSSLSMVVFGCLVIKGLLDNVLSDYLWARSVILTSATVANVGLGMTIPMAFVCDIAMGQPDVLNIMSICGALSVLGGFVLVNLAQRDEESTPSISQHQDDELLSHSSSAASQRGNANFV